MAVLCSHIPATARSIGDVNNDGAVTIHHARQILLQTEGLTASATLHDWADFDQDGKVTRADAFAIAETSTGSPVIIVAHPEYGSSEDIAVGSMVAIRVYGRDLKRRYSRGMVRIRHPRFDYHSGVKCLAWVPGEDQLLAHWETRGLDPSDGYVMTVQLLDRRQADHRLSGESGKAETVELVVSRSVELKPFITQKRTLVTQRDLALPFHDLDLTFQRSFTYDPDRGLYHGPLGIGWCHRYDIQLTERADGVIALRDPYGFSGFFMQDSDGDYKAERGDHRKLRKVGSGAYELRHKHGRVWEFDHWGRLTAIRSPDGPRVTLDYRHADPDRPDFHFMTDVRDGSGQHFHFSYDEKGRIIAVDDSTKRRVLFSYDSQDHLIRVKGLDGDVTRYGYDSQDRIAELIRPDGTTHRFEYDDQGRLSQEMEADGYLSLTYSYNSETGARKTVDAEGRSVELLTNELGQPLARLDGLGHLTTWKYDDNFNLIEFTDPNQSSWQMEFDDRGNCTSFTEPLGSTAHITYDSHFSHPISVIGFGGQENVFKYNEGGKLVSMTYPDGGTKTFTYDAVGNPVSATDRANETTTYAYDERGLIRHKDLPNEDEAQYKYNGRGHLVEAANSWGTLRFTQDIEGKTLSCEYPDGRAVEYEYDEVGRLTQIRHPDGKCVHYTYDEGGLLEEIRDGEKSIAEYVRDRSGHVIQKRYANGVVTEYKYDATGRVVNIAAKNENGTVVSTFGYQYDAAGNCLAKTTAAGTEQYEYDAAYRLTKATYPQMEDETFAYDESGNRTQSTRGHQTRTYSTNDLDQYTAVDRQALSYDARGNLTTGFVDGKLVHYEYDSQNRLRSVSLPDGSSIEYSYDALGRRVERRNGEQIRRYLWAGHQSALEESENHTILSRYAWGPKTDEALTWQRNGETLYFTQDAIMSVTGLTDSEGQVVGQYDYTVFGEQRSDGRVDTPFGFAGLHYNPETGLQYARTRHYCPSLGRFASVDTIGLQGGLNLYSYVDNNPTTYRDPYGRFAWVLLLPGVWGAVTGGMTAAQGAMQTAGSFGAFAESLASGAAPGAAAAYANPAASIPAGEIAGTIGPKVRQGIQNLSDRVRNWWPSRPSRNQGGGEDGGGVCPTFIQCRQKSSSVKFMTPHLDVAEEKLACEITVPPSGSLLRSDIPVFGVAGGTNFKEYCVEWGEGTNPDTWHEIARSFTPQPRTSVGLAEIGAMQGDVDIRGNLATWNTGLKNWEHLPWHPASDPTDLNGVYTLRVVAEGKDGQTVEDRVTCQVGRVIAQCRPGIATSPDQHVVLRFAEQSLSHPFRVYTILPIAASDPDLPPAPHNARFVGTPYTIREPGDRFIKKVTLEFTQPTEKLEGNSPRHAAIIELNVKEGTWRWLDSDYRLDDGQVVYTTEVMRLPDVQAVYALALDAEGERSSVPAASAAERSSEPVTEDVFIRETFEKDTGPAAPRDRHAGATINLKSRSEDSNALSIINTNGGGNFAVTLVDKPFDVRDFPVVSFDYCIPKGVRTGLYFRVHGRWYNLNLTDDPQQFAHTDVNIANLGWLEGTTADGRWHTARFNLADLLRQRTRHTRVKTVVMADWDVLGFMKLGFGHNVAGASYQMDDFTIAADPAPEPPALIAVDDFEDTDPLNGLRGQTNTFSSAPAATCLAETATKDGDGTKNRALQLTYDVTEPDSYAGYITLLNNADLTEVSAVSLRLWAAGRVPPMLIGLRHSANGAEAKVPLLPYIGPAGPDGWRSAVIPLSAFLPRGFPNLDALDALFFTFANNIDSGQGVVLVDDIRFTSDSAFGRVIDYSHQPMRFNLLGGSFETRQQYAAAISAGDIRITTPQNGTHKMIRISYGGDIGLDYGQGRFSYAVWKTGLMGLDVRPYEKLALEIRGQMGNEEPNVYLNDGTVRRCISCGPLKTDWQTVRLPLRHFRARGVDMSYLGALELAFEWERMSGTVYIRRIWFE